MNPDQPLLSPRVEESDSAARRRDRLKSLSADLFDAPSDSPPPSSRRAPWPDDPVVRRALEARSAAAALEVG